MVRPQKPTESRLATSDKIMLAIAIMLFLLVTSLELFRYYSSESKYVLLDYPAAMPSTGETTQQASRIRAASLSQGSSLPREQQRGAWIGNVWIPPHPWRYYSPNEIRKLYHTRSVLWIGDKTAIRAANTMFGILNSKHTSVTVEEMDAKEAIGIDDTPKPCNKWSTFCRTMPSGHLFVYIYKPCMKMLNKFLLNELSGESDRIKDIDVVVVSISEPVCSKPNRRHSTRNDTRDVGALSSGKLHQLAEGVSLQNESLGLLGELQSRSRAVIWRTSGFNSDGSRQEFVQAMNDHAMDRIDELAGATWKEAVAWEEDHRVSNLNYVDWGGVVLERSFGKQRITGDTDAHYGLEPRLALIQMITNQIISREETLVE